MSIERTLILIKPDGVARNLCGEVLKRIETKGYKIVAMQMLVASDEQLRAHYAEHVEKPFFASMAAFMSEGPLVAIVAEGHNVIAGFRSLAGATNPTTAAPGTIRGDLGREWGTEEIRNIVHGSDAVASAQREIAIWFPELND